MLEGNGTEYRATDWRTLQVKIFKLQTQRLRQSAARHGGHLRSCSQFLLVAVWDTSTKKIERQTILALGISFFSRVIDLGKVTGENFLASAAFVVQVQERWRRRHCEAHQEVVHGSTLGRPFVEIPET